MLCNSCSEKQESFLTLPLAVINRRTSQAAGDERGPALEQPDPVKAGP